MPRDISSLRQLNSLDEVINCLKEDPLDRFLMFSNDLSSDEFGENSPYQNHSPNSFYGGGPTPDRSFNHSTILTICSLKASKSANSVNQFTNKYVRDRQYSMHAYPDEIAVVGFAVAEEDFSRYVPDEINDQILKAKKGTEVCMLFWNLEARVFLLPEHPNAIRLTPFTIGFVHR